MIRLELVKVKGVRGIVDGPDLHIENGGLLLCGDNGTGKSSYIDAIEKILTDRCSSLDGSGRNVSWQRQGSHIDCSNSEIEITLTDGDKKVVVSLDTDISTLDKQTQDFLTAARQQSFVLRRRTLLDFINAAPQKRYQAIEYFLKLDEYETFETQLKDLLKETDTKISTTDQDKTQRERALKEILHLENTESVSEQVCMKTVNATLRVANIAPLISIADIGIRLNTIEDELTPFKDMGVLQKVQQLDDLIKQFPDVKKIQQSANQYLMACKEVDTEKIKLRGHFYAQVLEQGLVWVTEDKLDRCPLCDNQISLADVKAHVEANIAKHEQLIFLEQKQSDAHVAFLSTLEQIKRDNIQRYWQEIFSCELPAQIKAMFAYVERILKTHRNIQSAKEIENDVLKLPENSCIEGVLILQKEINIKLKSFPNSERYAQLYDAKSQLVTISVHLPHIERLNKLINYLKVYQGQLKIVVALAEKGRKNAVQKLLNDVVDIANKYFQKIHPGESIGKPELTIPDRGAGRIELSSPFHNKTGDPRGHYSEGHVDSLGLCLFLAIRRIHYTQHPELSLLILDDVMHSVDANHRRDTANLIFEEFSDHQIIITTHDPLWFEYLKSASRKSKEKIKQHRIAQWSLETGPIWGDHLSNHEWLISDNGLAAKPSDLVLKAGVLLEEMLQNLCSNLIVPVPFRIQGDYTIDPLWTSFFAAAKNNDEFYAKAKECLDEIDELRKLRNWVGAHWNEWAQTLTQNEAMAFTNSVIELRSYTYCDECSRFIKRIAELDGVWSCEKECKRYNKQAKPISTHLNTQLLSWQDLIAIGVPKGQKIANILNKISSEQKLGRITSREQAEIFVKQILDTELQTKS